jgi:recombination protein RecT
MRCAETGLEPIGPGGAWPVPFNNKHLQRLEVQFIPDWRGLIQLAKKTGQIKHAYGEIVRENDEVSYQKGDNPLLTHRPALRDRGEVMGAYCVVVLPDDSKHIEYMAFEEIESIRGRSKAGESGPWITDWGQMAIKTVVKRALKPFAGSPEMQTAIEYDNQVVGLNLPNHNPIPEPQAVKEEPQEGNTAPGELPL